MNLNHALAAMVVAGGFGLAGCQGSGKANETGTPSAPQRSDGMTSSDFDLAEAKKQNQAVLWIKGLACPFCVYNVERQLSRVPGVENVRVDLGSGRAVVALSKDGPPTEEQLRAAVKESGFTADRVEMP